MLFGVLTSVTLAVLANQAAAEPLRRHYKFHVAKMSVRNVFGLEGRQLSGYKPDEEFCTETGDTCAEACGDDFDQCASNDEFTRCFSKAKQTCCPNLSGGLCSELQPAYAHGSRPLCIINVIGSVDVVGDPAGDPVGYDIHHIFGDDKLNKDSGDGIGYIFGYVFHHVFGGYNVSAEDIDTDIRDNPTDDIERKPATQLHYRAANHKHHLLHAGQHHHFVPAERYKLPASDVTPTTTTLSSATESSTVDETLIKAPSITIPGAGGAGQQTATASDDGAAHASESCTTYTTISVATLTLTDSSSVPETPAPADSTPTSGPPAPVLANAASGHGPVFLMMLLATAGIAGALL
ncbi:hypothetical protein DL768_008828 [Monosporascus sp. mg162]|nr:hypothetical protein DL768_008828 [Monosporascus sp. mg162]